MRKDDPYAGLGTYEEEAADPYAGLGVVEVEAPAPQAPSPPAPDRSLDQNLGVVTSALSPYLTAAGLGAAAGRKSFSAPSKAARAPLVARRRLGHWPRAKPPA
jgi:hypothetical protein